MHNINYIRSNSIEFDNAMKLRGESKISSKIIEIDKEKRETQTILQNLLAERNKISKKIGEIKSKNLDASAEMKNVDEIKTKINTLKELEQIKDNELNHIIKIPNIPHNQYHLER